MTWWNRRDYDLKAISGWEVRGAGIQFTYRPVGQAFFADASSWTNPAAPHGIPEGIEVPARIATFRCQSAAEADDLTASAVSGGLQPHRVERIGT